MLNLQEFIKKYDGVPNVGNTPANMGECTGLVNLWAKNLSKGHLWGHARDLFNNASDVEWDKIENKPEVYPKAGDIMCWGKTWGGGYGHTGIVESSSPGTDSFKCFEQNYPTGSPPKIINRKAWNGIIGWLRPKGTTPDDCEERLSIMTTNRNDWKEKADGFENQILEERRANAKEIAAKEKIIDSQQILISELNSKAVSDDKTISTITKERDDWKKATGSLEGQFNTYREEKEEELGEVYGKLTDSEVRLAKATKKFEVMSIWDFIIVRYFNKGGV